MSITTIPSTHVGPTAEELARRQRCRDLRDLIRAAAENRRAIKAAYRLPHGSDDNKAAMAALRTRLGIDMRYVGPWNAHAIPSRNDGRFEITQLHVELAHLRGKEHCTAPKS